MKFFPRNYLEWILALCLVSIIVVVVVNVLNNRRLHERSLIRARVARVSRNDLKNLAECLDGWQKNHHLCYPGKPYWGPVSESMVQELGAEFHFDPFGPKNPRSSILLYSDGKAFYALISLGPDQDPDVTKGDLDDASKRESLLEQRAVLAGVSYDSSNGTISNGDIIRLRE